MPREMIQSDVGPYHVKVGWRADSHVQVGVEGDDGRSIFWLLFDGEDRMKIGRAVRALGSNTATPTGRERDLAEAVVALVGLVREGPNLEADKITATNDAESLALAMLGEDHRPAPDPLTLAEAVLNILDSVASGADGGPQGPAPESGHGSYAGLWATMDREGVNRLVRVLRRARDAAFGRDE